jgi:hypothetical protein
MLEYAITFYGYIDTDNEHVMNLWDWMEREYSKYVNTHANAVCEAFSDL